MNAPVLTVVVIVEAGEEGMMGRAEVANTLIASAIASTLLTTPGRRASLLNRIISGCSSFLVKCKVILL